MPRRLRVRQNPTASFFSAVLGLIFVGIGVMVVIPAAGAFGYLWTLAALAATVTGFYNALSRRGIASEIIEEDVVEGYQEAGTGMTVERRLRALEDLRGKSLVTEAEYAERRAAILRSL